VVLGVALAAVMTAAGANLRPAPLQAVEYTVQPGDTLWGLAGRQPLAGDRRHWVWALKKANRLSDATLAVGQVLLLPADRASARAVLRDPAGFRAQVAAPAVAGLAL
jgi:LysM repeat protein